MSFSTRILNTVLLAGLASSACAVAQQPLLLAGLPDAHSATNPAATPATPSEAVVVTKPVSKADQPTPLSEKIDRWVETKDLSFSFRYRKESSEDDYKFFNNGQQKSLVDGRFKFDRAGNYSINYHVSSGQTFNWAYTDEIADDFKKVANNPAGFAVETPTQLQATLSAYAADPAGAADATAIHSRGWAMSFRQLYFRAAPVKQIAVEYGSLGIDKGESTEATTYDDDGYVTGERIRFFDPKHLFFDQVAFTNAYEGDISTPSFFQRGQRLRESNYRQVLVAKHFGQRFLTSADYTFDKGTHTPHEAVLVKLPEFKVADSVRLELYQRLNDHVVSGLTFHAHQGFAVTGTKTFFNKFQLDGGYAHIDDEYGVLTGYRLLAVVGFSMNGDSYLTGNRAFTRANWKIAPGVSLYGYYTHLTSHGPPDILLINKEGVNGGMMVDLKKLINLKQQIF